MENIFLINQFKAGWDVDDLHDIDSQEAYCIYALEIPDEKIYGTEMAEETLEVVLTDIDKSELTQEWYLNLYRIGVSVL